MTYQERYDAVAAEREAMLVKYKAAMSIKNMKRGPKRSLLYAKHFFPFLKADIKFNWTTGAFIFDENPFDCWLFTTWVQRIITAGRAANPAKYDVAVVIADILNAEDPRHIKF